LSSVIRFLQRGYAVDFRCGHPEAAGLRVDVMGRLRGVEAFGRKPLKAELEPLRRDPSQHRLNFHCETIRF